MTKRCDIRHADAIHDAPEAVARLRAGRARLRGTVGALRAQLASASADDTARIRARVRELCALREAHEPVEDWLLERVLDKGLTPSERQIVFTSLAQHQALDGLLDAAGTTTERPEDSALLTHYLETLARHLEFEARQVEPLLARQLEAVDTQAEPLRVLMQAYAAALEARPPAES
jgi:hypothetical protein